MVIFLSIFLGLLLSRDSFKQNVHDKVFENVDVLFLWALLSQDIHGLEDDAESLLKEVISLWVTIRGFAMAASRMEVYKILELTS